MGSIQREDTGLHAKEGGTPRQRDWKEYALIAGVDISQIEHVLANFRGRELE